MGQYLDNIRGFVNHNTSFHFFEEDFGGTTKLRRKKEGFSHLVCVSPTKSQIKSDTEKLEKNILHLDFDPVELQLVSSNVQSKLYRSAKETCPMVCSRLGSTVLNEA
jgi:hypothetical protein